MIRVPATPDRRRRSIPRESGDDPTVSCRRGVWGWVFPARAGMIRGLGVSVLLGGGIPRESGDDPNPIRNFLEFHMYSPRERG